ncbi:hypothetical protein N7493_000716 [Penicillium malachiteum]|uniref:Zn(2)-C6 fungal-type domain-containing protein n=1 Tax=Penicillium malachiteum TaxID=1324776 RepID=A0AAD6N156_9EURO|nr:hypothetical protein N7493_000716 [Penicillium malachiteum]
MVGVGGRSKGCKTCRKRRVKCDEGKPTCQRCHKAGKTCEGYVQFAEFHDVTDRVARKTSPGSQSSSLVSSSASIIFVDDAGTAQGDFIEEPFLPLRINPAFDEQLVFEKNLVDRLFSWHENPHSPHSAGWIMVLLGVKEEDSVLNFSSFRALATAFFGKMRGAPILMAKSKKYYSRALVVLQTQLQDPEGVFEDEVLLGIVCMSIYELITFTDPSAWISHYNGMARLTALRGPHRHQIGVGHALLGLLRALITVACVTQRKRCFLEDPRWKTIPWEIRGLNSKIPVEEVYDFLVHAPGVIEDMDRLDTWDPNVPGKEEFRAGHIQRTFDVLEAAYAWRWRWEQRFSDSVFMVPTADLNPDQFSYIPSWSPFEQVLWFDERPRATELMNYSVARLIAMKALQRAGVEVACILQPEPIALPLLPMEGSRHDVAVEICRMAHYNMQTSLRSVGAFMLLFPLNIAFFHLDGDKDGVRPWLLKLMAAMNSRHGFEVGQLRKEHWPEAVIKQKLAIRNKKPQAPIKIVEFVPSSI